MPRDINDLAHATAYDSEGNKLGPVKEVFINDASGQPDFVEVGRGLLGLSSAIVPLKGHRLEGESLHLSFPKNVIAKAPTPDDDAHLTPQDHDALFAHYGLEQDDAHAVNDTAAEYVDHNDAEDAEDAESANR